MTAIRSSNTRRLWRRGFNALQLPSPNPLHWEHLRIKLRLRTRRISHDQFRIRRRKMRPESPTPRRRIQLPFMALVNRGRRQRKTKFPRGQVQSRPCRETATRPLMNPIRINIIPRAIINLRRSIPCRPIMGDRIVRRRRPIIPILNRTKIRTTGKARTRSRLKSWRAVAALCKSSCPSPLSLRVGACLAE